MYADDGAGPEDELAFAVGAAPPNPKAREPALPSPDDADVDLGEAPESLPLGDAPVDGAAPGIAFAAAVLPLAPLVPPLARLPSAAPAVPLLPLAPAVPSERGVTLLASERGVAFGEGPSIDNAAVPSGDERDFAFGDARSTPSAAGGLAFGASMERVAIM